jgi:hypothetical protein
VVQAALAASDYVVLSDLLNNYYVYYVGENPFEGSTAQEWLRRANRVYDNHDFQIYPSPVSPVSP